MKEKEVEFKEIELEDGTKMKVVDEETYNKQVQSYEEKQAELQAELEKEQAKEKNFSALRQKKLSELSEEERAALSEEKQEIMRMREEMDAEKAERTKASVDSWKMEAFRKIGVVDAEGNITDEETYKKVDAAYARFNDPEDTAEAVLRKVKSAYSLEFGSNPQVTQGVFSAAVPFGGGSDVPKPSDKELSDSQKGLAGRLNLGLDEDKK